MTDKKLVNGVVYIFIIIAVSAWACIGYLVYTELSPASATAPHHKVSTPMCKRA